MEGFLLVIVVAILIEALIQAIKAIFPEGATVPAWLWPTCSIALGVTVCWLAGVDALALLGVTLVWPWVGYVLTGVLVSRGSNFIYDLWRRVKEPPDAA